MDVNVWTGCGGHCLFQTYLDTPSSLGFARHCLKTKGGLDM